MQQKVHMNVGLRIYVTLCSCLFHRVFFSFILLFVCLFVCFFFFFFFKFKAPPVNFRNFRLLMKRKGPRNLNRPPPIFLGEAPFALCPSTVMAVSDPPFAFALPRVFNCCRIDNPSQGLRNARLNKPSSSRLRPSLASSSKFTCSVPPLCASVHL